ncbi:hypothetical protein EN833_03230 [Mesorhizobium sp. M4B.F.Ca.ET.190.01.1.1]|nr:hypothetical protein EN843_03225 [Mesorhizobium sp. M4B.F.Ca.ET.200.01.1.1]TGS23032.1 hypothetical protein EN833_03230 [Mesorhizobium sp. M4B.F.Ca.ET.190.01.1.1]TGT33867.1 hypothetical protein EN815_03225 [Mesorhizobium sp. M4B.F.Ca.ET.172.01.1.1]
MIFGIIDPGLPVQISGVARGPAMLRYERRSEENEMAVATKGQERVTYAGMYGQQGRNDG